eukprot:TRINITY_DN16788_c0_g1_i1.p1 TRINITY_DN16788_c0_g1~~TRINITY_DN16788_c0_g1_i1.p1  ORF type:complete len:371 (+),score=111.41 TRINITY_DN16788_c0_g1_i1:104-1114(+)
MGASADGGGAGGSMSSTTPVASSAPQAAAPPAPPVVDPALRQVQEALNNAEVIARDASGRPTIARQVDSTNGNAKTIVLGEEGQQAFGESTVKSLLDAPEQRARRWLDTLTTHQMRGLIHEVGQRLVDQSQVYHVRLKELKRLQDLNGFAYFGLTSDATAKELEAAYRTLAKKMHPDKNGGTEEAKLKFQTMKEKYEALKKALEARNEEEAEGGGKSGSGSKEEAGNAKDGEESGNGGVAGCILDGEKPPESEASRGPRRKEAYEEDDEDERPDSKKKEEVKKGALSYDPFDRGSIETCMWEMLEQLKHIRPQQEKLAQDLYVAMKQLHQNNGSCS